MRADPVGQELRRIDCKKSRRRDGAMGAMVKPGYVFAPGLSMRAFHEPAVIANVVWQSMNPLFSMMDRRAALSMNRFVFANEVKQSMTSECMDCRATLAVTKSLLKVRVRFRTGTGSSQATIESTHTRRLDACSSYASCKKIRAKPVIDHNGLLSLSGHGQQRPGCSGLVAATRGRLPQVDEAGFIGCTEFGFRLFAGG